MRILIQLAHPAFHRSKVNARLIAAVDGLADVTINNLYDAYPDFQIDTERERELLEAHDVTRQCEGRGLAPRIECGTARKPSTFTEFGFHTTPITPRLHRLTIMQMREVAKSQM